MATIDTLFGWRVVIYSNDHRPPHIHIIGNGREAIFNLQCPDGPFDLRKNYGFSCRDIVRMIDKLAGKPPAYCYKWRQIHGCDTRLH
jgi:hypothetical protein